MSEDIITDDHDDHEDPDAIMVKMILIIISTVILMGLISNLFCCKHSMEQFFPACHYLLSSVNSRRLKIPENSRRLKIPDGVNFGQNKRRDQTDGWRPTESDLIT